MDSKGDTSNQKEVNPFQAPAGPIEMVTSIESHDLNGVRSGLKLVYNGIVVCLIGCLIGIIYGLGSGIIGFAADGSELLAISMSLLVGILLLIGQITIYVGQIRCISIPAQTGAKKFAIAAVVMQSVSFGLTLSVLILSWIPPSSTAIESVSIEQVFPLIQVLNVAGILFGVIGFFCFLVFIRRVAGCMGRLDLITFAGKVIGVFATAIILYFTIFGITLAIASTIGPSGPANSGLGLLGFLGCGMVVDLILLIIGVCMYTILLRGMIRGLGEPGVQVGIQPDPTGIQFVEKNSAENNDPDITFTD